MTILRKKPRPSPLRTLRLAWYGPIAASVLLRAQIQTAVAPAALQMCSSSSAQPSAQESAPPTVHSPAHHQRARTAVCTGTECQFQVAAAQLPVPCTVRSDHSADLYSIALSVLFMCIDSMFCVGLEYARVPVVISYAAHDHRGMASCCRVYAECLS